MPVKHFLRMRLRKSIVSIFFLVPLFITSVFAGISEPLLDIEKSHHTIHPVPASETGTHLLFEEIALEEKTGKTFLLSVTLLPHAVDAYRFCYSISIYNFRSTPRSKLPLHILIRTLRN
jgi:hypothetical protein